MRTSHKKALLGAFVTALCLMLGYSTVTNYMVEYSTINEVLESETPGKDVHVIGDIEPSSFAHLHNDTYIFVLTDSSAPMNVTYTGSLPSSLSKDSEIVVVGTMSNRTFNAKKLIARCPSKFTE